LTLIHDTFCNLPQAISIEPAMPKSCGQELDLRNQRTAIAFGNETIPAPRSPGRHRLPASEDLCPLREADERLPDRARVMK